MTIKRQRLGRCSEQAVAEALKSAGARVLDRNARVAGIRGELDLVVLDGPDLVFVEVKSLRAGGMGGPSRPAEAVGPRKQAKLRALAGAWMGQRRGRLPRFDAVRFDVVGLRVDDDGAVVEWEHLRGAF